MFGIDYSTNSNYQEILKLDRMLTDASIPHTLDRLFDGWQVCYPTREEPELVMDAIEHYGSYGKDEDKLKKLVDDDMSRMRWKVMKAFGLPPTSPLIQKMNDFQWSYCFLNLAKDAEEDDISESSDSHIMTPEEFAKAMKKASDYDEEDAHSKMDGIMADLLRQLGYGEGIDIFDNTSKWYA